MHLSSYDAWKLATPDDAQHFARRARECDREPLTDAEQVDRVERERMACDAMGAAFAQAAERLRTRIEQEAERTTREAKER